MSEVIRRLGGDLVFIGRACECGGPIAFPDDVTQVSFAVVATKSPDKVRQIHAEDCRWADQELPLDSD